MYHSGRNPLRKVTRTSAPVYVPKGLRQRRLHKAFLRYHDPANWPMLREALKRMGREDLIGPGKRHLIPAWQPRGEGARPEGARRPAGGTFRTQHVREPTGQEKKSRTRSEDGGVKPPRSSAGTAGVSARSKSAGQRTDTRKPRRAASARPRRVR
jgi:hypothetical protein